MKLLFDFILWPSSQELRSECLLLRACVIRIKDDIWYAQVLRAPWLSNQDFSFGQQITTVFSQSVSQRSEVQSKTKLSAAELKEEHSRCRTLLDQSLEILSSILILGSLYGYVYDYVFFQFRCLLDN